MAASISVKLAVRTGILDSRPLMEVNWNGDVPLCCYSLAQYGPPGFMLGNVNDGGLHDMWNGPILRTYRKAHRERIHELMPICRGCAAI